MSLSAPAVNTAPIYKVYWTYWKILAVEPSACKPPLRYLFDVLINVFVTLLYPTHLLIGLLQQPTLQEIFKNLPILTACISCSVKILCFRYKLPEIKQMQLLLTQLDERAASQPERAYFDKHTRRDASFIWRSFLVAYSMASFTGFSSVFFTSGRELLYPAWLPYDVQATAWRYWLTYAYQIVGASLTVLQNLVNDSYPPMTLSVVAGHVRLLAMRIEQIGQANESMATKRLQLVECIEDHKKLNEIVRLLRGTLYFAQLSQFISTGINISTVLIYILFFAENAFVSIYYVVYFMSMVLELFPSCYYGTVLTMEFDSLPYALFSSNWLGMDRQHMQSMNILMQLTLGEVILKAGGIVSINLDSFFATMRAAYSLFTLTLTLK